MGNHRAERRGSRRAPSETLQNSGQHSGQHSGRRVAGRSTGTPDAPVSHAPVPQAAAVLPDFDLTEELPLTAAQPPGRRKAVKHAGARGSLFRGLPSAPILLGVAALAISAGGAVSAAQPGLVGQSEPRLSQASALTGSSETGRVNTLETRSTSVSRDSRRDALADAADADLVAQAEAQMEERNAALAKFAQQAEQQAAKIELNQWVYPTSPVTLTARFGEYGLWSTYHTGLDFNGNTGDPIHAVAGGVVTSAGYDGSYGNKTVITLEDGTEIWYCHQTTFGVSVGDVVTAGELIGTVGATGHVTGSHLHLEVRPGGGDPVDPYAAMQVHGLFS